ncbi:hypothetical protein XENORESO_004903 [Xenotaenia resolanae]|uniref:Uncharacterized protein n=1 Tax=Xenotaenia resolanae TaxID=208358 RepID=A0ABV0W850_9TELE
MPQPGMNGMEPAFGEAYGSHRGLLSPCPLAMSPQGGRTDYDQSVLLMLGSPASPRKRPFELLSDLVDDGGFGEDQHPERWDVSALDEMARYTKLGLGVGGELLACSEEAILMDRWGRSLEEQEKEEEEWKRRDRCAAPAVTQEVQVTAVGKEEGHGSVTIATQGELCAAGKGMGDEQDEEVSQECTVEAREGRRLLGLLTTPSLRRCKWMRFSQRYKAVRTARLTRSWKKRRKKKKKKKRKREQKKQR